MCKYICSLALLLAACGSDGETVYEISEQTLQGSINGKPWTFVSGFAEDIFDDGKLWIELHPTEAENDEPCGFMPFDSEAHIILSLPPEEMDKKLSFSNNITFTHGDSKNDVGTSGRLVVDTVTDSTIGGGLYAKFGSEHEVDGRWQVTICD